MARSDLGVAGSALGGRDKLVDAGWVLGVNSTHVVATNKLNSASSGPGGVATIAKIPGLLEHGAWWEDSAISNRITDEVSDQLLINHSSRKLLGLFLNLRGLLLNLDRLGWLEISDSLDLSGSVSRLCGSGLSSLGIGSAAAVTHLWHWLAVLVVAQSGNGDVANRCLELDERVGLVVWVGWAGFAACTEIGVVADSALVAVTFNERLIAISWVAKWSITVDAVVACSSAGRVG